MKSHLKAKEREVTTACATGAGLEEQNVCFKGRFNALLD